ncbi:MAG: UDP-3-O-(3-hydroxymyristoyl)glucosamine N-acyltransferase [Tahibacter sp.]
MSTPPSWSLDEIAQRFALDLHGDGSRRVHAAATLSNAGPGQLSFLANPQYRSQLNNCAAEAVILRTDDVALCPTTALVATDPYVAYARVASLFEQRPSATGGIHPSAVIAADAQIDASASVGAQCVIESGARIDARAEIGPGCIIGANCHVGADCRLIARVTLVTRVYLGQRVLLHPGVVIGSDGFGLAFERDRWIKVPQLGGVRIGDDCEIGANCTIDRGAIDDTVLEEDVRLDNQIQIAHNVFIGAHTAMAGCSAVAGSARIGRYCLIGGAAGILGHLSIADRVTITAMSLVTHSIHAAGEYSSGTPLQENRRWRKNAARFRHLDEFARRLQALEKDSTE